MSDSHGFSLTVKHREDFEKVADYVKQLVREKSLELLGEDLSVDDDFVGLGIDEETKDICWHDYGLHEKNLDFWPIAESVIKEFPEVEMDLSSWWGPQDQWTYMIVDGHWKECIPWKIVAYTESESDYQRLLAIAKQNGVVPENLDMELREERQQVLWTYKELKNDDIKDELKEKCNNLTKDLVERLSRNLGDAELLVYYYDDNCLGCEISEIFKAKNGYVVMEQVDKGITYLILEDSLEMDWKDRIESLLLHPVEKVAEMVRRAREGDDSMQWAVRCLLGESDTSLFESLLTEEDKTWLEKQTFL